jgi:hypothetical protein
MSGIAPLSGPITATAPAGVAPAAPSSIAPAPPAPTPTQASGFTAFPSSYAGFGTNGSSFGTLGVVNGKLSIISTPANSEPSAATAAPADVTASAPAADTAPASTAGDQIPNPYTAVPAADQTSTTTATGKNAAPETTPANVTQGLLGSPPTNPIVIQAEAQEAAAAEATRLADSEQAAQQAADQVQLQQLDQRIAAARASDDPAAVAQLQPDVSKIEGRLQGQTFAGVGATPPLPFATPEIPTVFLNVAA